jgi:RHS repeat-associated protein
VEATAAHTHTILSLQTGSFGTAGTLFTSAASNMPPYQEVPYAQKTLDDGLEFPVGSVMMWEGTNCPATWQRYTLLDGRFPLGAGFVNAAGGAATHTHTYTQLPPHTHNQGTLTLVASGAHQDSINYRSPSTVPGSAGVFGSANPAAFKSGLLSNSGAHNHNGALTGSTGVTGVATATTQTASNLPPYTSLVFCKKISATQISAGTTSTVHKYYFSGAQRVAMRENTTLYFLAGDHLGSTSLIIDANGNKVGEMRYKPWGETRYSWSSLPSFPTNYQYTGQRNNPDIGLYYYNARWYDPSLGRFTQVDTNIPLQQGTQSWDRYAYVNNNPSRYTDPSGHCFFEPLEFIFCATVAVAFIAEAAPVISQFLAEEGPALEPEIEEAALEAAPAIEEAFAEGEQALINAEEELRTFYHATNAQGEESILNNGINLDKGRPNLDFNPANQKGFYLTQDYEQAQSWANKFGEDGRIVQFKIPQSQLNNLNSKIFSQGNDEWLDFALRGRSGLLQHAFDFVEGPYLKLKDLTPAGHQLAIFTQSAVHIFNNYIMK